MAQTISDPVLSSLARALLGGVSYAGPATLYVAFFTGASVPLTGGTEASGNNYSRTPVANNTTNFPSATGSGGTITVANGTPIVSPRSTGSWGSAINCVRLYDNSGNVLAGAMLSPTRNVDAAGITITIEAGAATFALAST